jgi:hypothetical protein
MGRGAQATPTQESFQRVFGARRGQYDGGRFLRLEAHSPDREQWAMAEALIERSREEAGLSLLIKEMLPCASLDPLAAPLLGLMVHETSKRVTHVIVDGWVTKAIAVADILDIHSKYKSRTLVCPQKGGAVHIWPEGVAFPAHTFPAHREGSGKTLCGKAVDCRRWERLPRGRFTGSGVPCTACRRAAEREPELYPEAFETSDGAQRAWPRAQEIIGRSVGIEMRSSLLGLLREGADSTALQAHAQILGKRAFMEFLVEEATAHPGWPTHNTLAYYSSTRHLAAELGVEHGWGSESAERTFASWLKRVDWEALVEGAVGGWEPGDPLPSRSAWVDALVVRLRLLGQMRGLPATS